MGKKIWRKRMGEEKRKGVGKRDEVGREGEGKERKKLFARSNYGTHTLCVFRSLNARTVSHTHIHTHILTALVRDYPGEPVPES